MSFNNKNTLLAVAIVGSLASVSASAAVTLAGTPTTAPVTYASEISVPANTTLNNPGNLLDIITTTRYAFSDGEVRYARIECGTPSNFRFNSGAVGAVTGGTVGSVNGLGSNAISFSITANTTTDASGIASSAAITFAPTNTGVTMLAKADISCSYGLYDQPSQAQAGGTAGRIASASGAYIAFATGPSYALNATGANATASVGATPAYSSFLTAGSGTGAVAAGSAPLGNIVWALDTATRYNTSGVAITLADLFAVGTAGSSHVVSGDFTALANTNGTYTGAALSRIFVNPSTNANCGATTGAIIPDALTASTATFRNAGLITASAAGFICFVPTSGVAIPAAGPYTIAFNGVSANTAVYTVTNVAAINLGSISRDGTQLVAPLAQMTTGFLSRIVLNNTGSAAQYTIALTPAAGSTYSGSTTSTGTLAAGTTLFQLPTLFPASNFTGQPRGTITVTVSTPRSTINGVYQIVEQNTGAISNHVMVQAGTN